MKPMLALLPLSLALIIYGCAVVEVRTPGQPPDLSIWPGGVRVVMPDTGAASVSAKTVGLSLGCGAAGIGYTSLNCISVDPKTCGVAIIIPNDTTDENELGKIADEVKAECLKERKPK